MTTLVILGMLCALVAVVVFRPLWLRDADRAPGLGWERPSPAEERAFERERLREQLRDLEQAKAEGKLDAAAYADERARLAVVVDETLAPRGAEPSTAPAPESLGPRPRQTYPVSAVAGWGTLIALTLVTALIVEGNDVVRNVSPHGAGGVPTAAPGAMIDAEGQPDIGAMVARLEARVRSGNADAQDITMLERTYEVLGRTDELTGMFRTALSENPNNAVVLMALGLRQFEAGGKLAAREAEEAFDQLLVMAPELPQALWFKSQLLVRRGEKNEAITLLRRMLPLVVDDSVATAAVTELLAELGNDPGAAVGDGGGY